MSEIKLLLKLCQRNEKEDLQNSDQASPDNYLRQKRGLQRRKKNNGLRLTR